ncbi:hypothetical protein Ancab_001154 [Ancistrocladus abbreviatus]
MEGIVDRETNGIKECLILLAVRLPPLRRPWPPVARFRRMSDLLHWIPGLASLQRSKDPSAFRRTPPSSARFRSSRVSCPGGCAENSAVHILWGIV